jgi:hypothetical protein
MNDQYVHLKHKIFKNYTECYVKKGCTWSRIRNRILKDYSGYAPYIPSDKLIFSEIVEFEKASPCMTPHGPELVGRAGQYVRIKGPARLYLSLRLYARGWASLSGKRALHGFN